ncbi:TonB-dependent receptor [Sphingomonas sabuli]|uniref:TonB-dependent receptor n=1 Tax=Sphingomonas sabuli TaxID=2764186 RepID=A0A7G9L0K7_9SPHN|nr:TonB-dependent receptor [Sphingomonas sabuli]QNM82156.1 TonB-dependent receptor [Sphingomonas sabuli]
MVSFSARTMLLGSAAAAALIASPALAQEAPPATGDTASNQETQAEPAQANDQEIVVTARRRNEVLLDVPIAVTAYSGEQLSRQGALDITDVGDTTPNVTLETSRGTNTTLTAFIRGVGQQDPVAGFEQGVGIYLDDVYLNRPQGAVLDIYDVERIEVLRGPQGTLYGRNTIGGAIKYVTRRLAATPQFKARTNLGLYDQADLVLTASAPVADALRIGGSVARLSRSGWGKNYTTGEANYNKDIWAARGTIELIPTETAWLRLSGDYTWDKSNARGGHRLIPSILTKQPVLDDVFDSRGGLTDPKQKVTGGGVALHGEAELNDWLTVRSITAYRKDKSATPIDFDALPSIDLDVPAIYRNKQFSQELQAVIDRGPLAGVVGAYYLDANAQNIFDVRLYTLGALIGAPGFTAATFGDVDTKTWAIFGDFTYDFTPQWSVSLGGRYTNDKRRAQVLRKSYILGGSPELGGDAGYGAGIPIATTSDFSGRRTDTAFTPRASVTYKPNRNHTIYASFSQGFKGGGFDPRAQSTQAPVQTPAGIYDYMAFEPEKVNSYELGWKAALGRLQVATAIFNADYKNVQIPASVGCIVNGVTNFCGLTTNAGKARFRGLEIEANYAVAENFAAAGDKLSLAGTLGYLDAKYREFLTIVTTSPAGAVIPPTEINLAPYRKVQNTPKWTMSGSLDYTTPMAGGRLNLNSTLSYRSKSQQFELRTPMLDQKGYALLDANMVWRSGDGRYEVGLHGKNLTNTKYITAGYNFLTQNIYTGDFVLNPLTGNPIPAGGLGQEGVLTAYYGNPRQIFVSLGFNF